MAIYNIHHIYIIYIYVYIFMYIMGPKSKYAGHCKALSRTGTQTHWIPMSTMRIIARLRGAKLIERSVALRERRPIESMLA